MLKKLILISASVLLIPFTFSDDEVEEVVVTGSFIKTDRENLAIPVDVFDRGEYTESGQPNMRDILRNMPSVSGTINQSEQFSDGGGDIAGTKNVNIRALGIPRTLVLFNGKRIVHGPGTTKENNTYVDVGNFPMIQMERLEVLKNGGAVSHGTDAIGGVFNFITRNKFEGFEATVSQSDLDASDGTTTAAFIAGFANGGANFTFGAEWEDITSVNIAENPRVQHKGPSNSKNYWPLGYSVLGNPGTFQTGAGQNLVQDPACGITASQNGVANARFSHDIGPYYPYSRCGYSYVPYGNYIDPQERHKYFATFNMEITDEIEVYFQANHSTLKSAYFGSPTYPPSNAGYFTVVPKSSPGYVDFAANHLPTLSQDIQDAYGAASPVVLWWGRACAIGCGPQIFNLNGDTSRWSIGSTGILPGTDYDFDISLTYSTMTFDYTYSDVHTGRYNSAVSGLGGWECSGLAADAGDNSKGCYYYNVFGTALTAPEGSDLRNSDELFDYLRAKMGNVTERNATVFDFVLNGDMNYEIDGNPLSFAAGVQVNKTDTNDLDYGDNTCPQNQPCEPLIHFLPNSYSSTIEGKNISAFAEISIPATEMLDVNLGVRWEDYDLDNVTVPKISAIFQATDSLVLRASYEEVFRSPEVPRSMGTALEKIGSEYVEIQTPIPTSLSPESSDNINIGFIWTPVDDLKVSMDYYSLDLVDNLGVAATSSALSTTNCLDGNSYTRGSEPDSCLIKNITAPAINGDGVETSGLDFAVTYDMDTELGLMQLSLSGVSLLKYDVANSDGTTYDAKGKYNTRATNSPIRLRSMPELKFNLGMSLMNGSHFTRAFVRYISDYDVDDSFEYFPDFNGTNPAHNDYGTPLGIYDAKSVDSDVTLDIHYTYSGFDNLELTLSVVNVTDEDPPFAPHEQAYDAFSHSAMGRITTAGINFKF